MKQSVNERVKLLRSSLKLTQVEFSNELQISPSSIAKIEAGEKPSISILDAMIEKFRVPEEWLLHGKGEMTYIKPVKAEFDPATDTLYNELKEQITFLRETIKALTNKQQANFRNRLWQAPVTTGHGSAVKQF